MRLPTPIHRSYRRRSRDYSPRSIPGLALWYPQDGRLWQDSGQTLPAGSGDPVAVREDYGPGGKDLTQATTAKKPTLNSIGPATDFDMVDDLLRANYELDMNARWMIALALWARDDSDRISLRELDAVTNLAGEFGWEVELDDNFQVAMPGNWDPNDFAMAFFAPADFASGPGKTRHIFGMKDTGGRWMRVIIDAANGRFTFSWKDGTDTISSTTTLSPSFTAGEAVFVGVRVSGGTATLYHDTNGDGTLETAVGAIATPWATSGSQWTLQVGRNVFLAQEWWEGAINGLIGEDGSDATFITDRYNGGAGMAIEEWSNRHSDKLVLGVMGNDDGSAYALKTAYNSAPAVTRNDTGRWVDWTGLVRTASANVLRNRHRAIANDGNSYRATLLERAYTNLVTSDNFDSGWTSVNGPTVAGSQADPAGGSTAYTIEDSGAGSIEYKTLSLSFMGDGEKSVVFVFSEATMPASGNQQLVVRDTSASADAARVNITGYTGGEPTLSAVVGTVLGKVPLADGFWAVVVQTVSVTAANNHEVQLIPAISSSVAGSFTFYRVNAYNAAVPPASILDAIEVTTADDLTVPLKDTTPQEATYLYEGVVLDLPNTGASRKIWNFGSGSIGTSAAHIGSHFDANNNLLYIDFGNGSANVSGYWSVPSLALYDHIAIRIYQASNGAITAGLSINGGAEDTTLDGAIGTQALPGSWANNNVRFSGATGAADCNSGLISFKAQSGSERTLAQMQALVDPDIAVYRSGQTSELADLSPSVATKGVPSRVPLSFSKDGALQPYIYAAVADDEKLEIGGRDDTGTRTEGSSSGSITTGVHSLILEWDGTDTLTAYLDNAQVAQVTLSGAFTALDRFNLGGLPLFVEGHPFDERIGELFVHAGADFPGSSAIDRKRIHNYLAERTTGLAAV